MPSKAIIVKFLKIFVLVFRQCTQPCFLMDKNLQKSFKKGYKEGIFED